MSRKYWDHLFSKVPGPVQQYPVTVPDVAPKAAPGPKHSLPTTPEVIPVSSNPHQGVVEAFAQLAMFQPESATEMARFLEFHQNMFHEVGVCYTTLADRMAAEMPYGTATPDSLRDLGAAFSGLAGVAESVHQTFRAEHAEKLAGIETPPPGAEQWDQRAQ